MFLPWMETDKHGRSKNNLREVQSKPCGLGRRQRAYVCAKKFVLIREIRVKNFALRFLSVFICVHPWLKTKITPPVAPENVATDLFPKLNRHSPDVRGCP